MKVEFILCYDNHTWDTAIENVPNHVTACINYEDPAWDAEIIGWAYYNLLKQARYQNVTHLSIYNSNPEEL